MIEEFEGADDIPAGSIEAEKAEEIERERRAARLAELDALEAEDASETTGLPNQPPGGDIEFTGLKNELEDADPLSVVGLAKSIGSGAINAPGNIIGGAIGGVAESFETVADLIDDGNRKLLEMGVPGVVFGGEGGIGLESDPDEFESSVAAGIRNKGEQLPELGEEDSAIRAMSKFFTGFAAGGKALKGTKLAANLATKGFAGQSALAGLKGVIADFAFMDEMDNPANALVEAFPSLEGPVSEFFSADEDSTDTENRFKNALLGAGLGAAADGTFAALKATRNVIRARATVQSVDEAVEAATRQVKIANAAHKDEFNRLLGDVDAPAIQARAPVAAAGGAAPISPQRVIDKVVSQSDSGVDVGAINRTIRDQSDFYIEESVAIDAVRRPSGAVDGALADASKGSIVIDSSGEIIDGRHRFQAALDAGETEVSVIRPMSAGEIRAAKEATKSAVDDPGEVFINWARIDTEDDVKEAIQMLADNDSAEIAMSQRGVRSHIDTEASAAELNAWDTLVSRRHGEALNAEQALAARKLWASSGRKTLELSELASVKGASEATQIAFRKQLALHSTIQRQVMGARTETARALNSWKIPAGDDFAFFSQMDALTSEMERGVPTRQLAQNLQTLQAQGDFAAVDTFMYGAGRVQSLMRAGEKASGVIRQFWYFSLLSRATTHIRNFVGNSSRLAMEVMDRRVASAIGEVLGDQQVPTGETAALIHGQVQGAIDAFRIGAESRRSLITAGKLIAKRQGGAVDAITAEADGFGTFWKSVATGDSGFGIGKVDTRVAGALSPETLGLDPASNWGRVFNVIDNATSVPGRALAAGDEIFKTMSFNGERHALAFRKAASELDAGKITQEGFGQRVAEIVNDPDEALKLLMRDAAQKNTFTNDPIANGGSHKIWNFVKSTQQIPVLGRLAMPFGRTPYNIANESLRRSPIGILMPGFWNDLAQGGAKADIAWAKLLTGNAILLGMADLALSGRLVGERPRVNRESGRRSLEHRLDIKSMTFRIDQGNGKTLQIPYRGFEPITYPMGLAANLVEIMDSDDFRDPNVDTQNLIVAAAGSLAMQMSSANYMRGVSELFSYVADPGRYGERYIEGIVRSMVPGAVSQFVSGQDPYIREIDGWADAFIAQVPVKSRSLPVRRDVWGKPLERKATGVLGSIIPYQTDSADLEPIDKELARIQYYPADPKPRIGLPITDPGDGADRSVTVDLDQYPGAFSRYKELYGLGITDPEGEEPPLGVDFPNPPDGYTPEGRGLLGELNAIVEGKHGDSFEYEDRTDGPDGGKAGYIQAVTNYYRQVARFRLLEEFPEIAAEVESRRDEAPRKFIWEQEQLQ